VCARRLATYSLPSPACIATTTPARDPSRPSRASRRIAATHAPQAREVAGLESTCHRRRRGPDDDGRTSHLVPALPMSSSRSGVQRVECADGRRANGSVAAQLRRPDSGPRRSRSTTTRAAVCRPLGRRLAPAAVATPVRPGADSQADLRQAAASHACRADACRCKRSGCVQAPLTIPTSHRAWMPRATSAPTQSVDILIRACTRRSRAPPDSSMDPRTPRRTY